MIAFVLSASFITPILIFPLLLFTTLSCQLPLLRGKIDALCAPSNHPVNPYASAAVLDFSLMLLSYHSIPQAAM